MEWPEFSLNLNFNGSISSGRSCFGIDICGLSILFLGVMNHAVMATTLTNVRVKKAGIFLQEDIYL